ncbi:hypothetical protein HUJ05_007729, partial [Dendroctonus ponderosae]
ALERKFSFTENSNSRAVRSSVPLSQRQECTASKDKVTELENMLDVVLSNAEMPSTGKNLFIQSIQNIISTEEYNKLNNAYSYLSVQIQQFNDQIQPPFSEEHRKNLGRLNTKFLKLSTAFNNTIKTKKLCISEIGNGNIETAVSKFKELKEFGSVNLLHNIIDIAYAKYDQMNNFDNIIHFIAQLPWFLDKVISYEVVYNMMEKNTPKILVFLTQIENMLNNSYMIDDEPAFVPRLNGLKSIR